MKKKLIPIIIVGSILAVIIFKVTYHEELNILTLGDSLSIGMTSFNIKGYSFNDYLKDYYEENHNIREYITEFSEELETTNNLNKKIFENYHKESFDLTIKQAIKKAKIITLAIGTDELYNKKEIKEADIENYLNNLNVLINNIRILNKKKLVVVGLFTTKKINKEKTIEINKKIENIAQNNNCLYVDILDIVENAENIFKRGDIYLNYKGHKIISERIYKLLN